LTPEEHNNVSEYNFDHPNAMDQEAIMQCLLDLKARKAVEVPIYDFKTHSRSTETQRVEPADVIIFEGILARAPPCCAHACMLELAAPRCAEMLTCVDCCVDARTQTLAMDDVRQQLNMKIFVDTDDDVRLARRIKRDTCDRGRDVHGVIEQYTKFVKPMFDAYVSPSKKHADVIIPWAGGENGVAIDLIVQHIRTKLGQNDLRRIFNNLKILPSNFQIRGMHTIIRDKETGAPACVRRAGCVRAATHVLMRCARLRACVRAQCATTLCSTRTASSGAPPYMLRAAAALCCVRWLLHANAL
jgi:uridine kinase